MLRTEIKVPANLSRIIERLIKSKAGVGKAVSAVVRTSAINVQENSRDMCPVATGAFRRNIKPVFIEGGMAAIISTNLPYAAKWEYSEVAHPVIGKGQVYVSPTSGRTYKSSKRIKMNTNPNATWGFMRKGLAKEAPNFIAGMENIARGFGR